MLRMVVTRAMLAMQVIARTHRARSKQNRIFRGFGVSEAQSGATIVVVELPSSVFNIEAAKRAAYVMMRRATVVFEDMPSGVRCLISGLATPSEPMGILERDFRRELIDQELRLSIESKTQPMRDAILGLAFSRTGLQG